MASNTQYRGIIRISYDSDKSSAFRAKAKPILESSGFQNTKTGVWEVSSQDLTSIRGSLNQTMDLLVARTCDETDFTLDHIWVYIDRITSDEPTPSE